ncbi:MAG: methylated-DNA--[protein]-cysteine S-methyltransferase [Clostridia bacterium]|nr:methylated-DNA--[protein]-cysteine S-methyltransferase [Clostridia bacterium]
MMSVYKAYYKSEVGLLEIAGNEDGICGLGFIDDNDTRDIDNNLIHPSLQECHTQIDEYFRGVRKEFTVNLQLSGTEFQRKVWEELCNIPYGQAVSYKDVAVAIGSEKAVRAVGNANRNNQIAIIIPCHRVIGSNRKLTGYAGGLWRKEWLLEHERQYNK